MWIDIQRGRTEEVYKNGRIPGLSCLANTLLARKRPGVGERCSSTQDCTITLLFFNCIAFVDKHFKCFSFWVTILIEQSYSLIYISNINFTCMLFVSDFIWFSLYELNCHILSFASYS